MVPPIGHGRWQQHSRSAITSVSAKRPSLTAFAGTIWGGRKFFVSPQDYNADPIVNAEHFVHLNTYPRI